MRTPPRPVPTSLPITPAADPSVWAEAELGHARLGDARRTRRATAVLAALADQPTAAISEALPDPLAADAAYRLLENPAIAPEAVRDAHFAATAARIHDLPLVLVLHDTTELDWTSHPATSGLGPLSAPTHRGLHVHSALAVTPDGVPLGLLAQQVWARDPATVGIHHRRKERPFAEKESSKWTTGIAASTEHIGYGPRLIHIGDQESDIYDVFVAARQRGDELLLRSAWSRRTTDAAGQLSKDVLTAAPLADTRVLHLNRTPKRHEREATLTLRWTTVTLEPPKHRAAEHLPPITVTLIAVTEVAPPPGEPPIEWVLLTTVPTETVADAWERVGWYALRWRIERYHYVLKSGCRLEDRQLQTADRLDRLLAFEGILAWRVLALTYLARSAPEAPATWLSEADAQVLWIATGHAPLPPAQRPTNRAAVRALAKLGGFLGRSGDGEPGVTVLWRGLQRFTQVRLGAQAAYLLLDSRLKE